MKGLSDTQRGFALRQDVQFDIPAQEDLATEELVSPVSDLIDFLQRLPYAGTLRISMRFDARGTE